MPGHERRLVRADQCHLVPGPRQMPRRRRADKTAPDHRDAHDPSFQKRVSSATPVPDGAARSAAVVLVLVIPVIGVGGPG